MRDQIIEFFIRRILKKCCPNCIPRSGEEGEKVNCYSIKIYDQHDSVFLVRGAEEGHLAGLWLSRNGKFENEASVPLRWVKSENLRVTHYYGLYTIAYGSFWKYVFTGATLLYPLRAQLHKHWDNLAQRRYNRKRLATIQRLKTLEVLIDYHVRTGGKSFNIVDLMTELHTIRWVLHPEGDIQEKKTQLYLESFIDTGEVKRIDTATYVVTGKAVSTLSKYEEDERRHKENARLQALMVALTIALVVVGVIQAYVTFVGNKR